MYWMKQSDGEYVAVEIALCNVVSKLIPNIILVGHVFFHSDMMGMSLMNAQGIISTGSPPLRQTSCSGMTT